MTDPYPELVIESRIGVCSVRDDTLLLAQLAHSAQPVPGKALDLGTGSGYVGLYLTQRGWQAEAVDLSPRSIELARRNATRNDINLAIYPSNLFDQVRGPYDVIAFNPPMRPTENEWSRLMTSTLRRSPRISGWLMRVLGDRLETGRLPFLTQVLSDSRRYLTSHGVTLLAITDAEADELARLEWVEQAHVTPIPNIPGQVIGEYHLDTQPRRTHPLA